MASMRNLKKTFREMLQAPDWLSFLPEISAKGMEAVAPLLSFLLQDPLLKHRAARALGLAVAEIHKKNPEQARNIIRRFMWHLNEDSGNIGWGIPEAFAETLAASPELAKEYGHILISYIMDLGHADNYIDLPLLRRSCYWGIGRLAQTNPEIVEKYRKWLLKGLSDEDEVCRGMAAWALSYLSPQFMDFPLLQKLADAQITAECDIFENDAINKMSVSQIARNCLDKWR